MGTVFVLSAPSGAGKSTLIRRALAAFPALVFSVSATTRNPRPGEADGREYHFKSKEEFRAMIERAELAEWQEIYGNYYGTPKGFILDRLAEGKSVILDIDVYGKTRFDRVFPDAVGIFVGVPSRELLRERLQNRKTETAEELEKRLRIADQEIEYAKTKGKYEYWIINDDLERAVQELFAILRRYP